MTLKRANGTERALDLIEALSDADSSLSRAALVQRTGMPRSTVYALSELLLARQWLVEQPGGQLVLGPKAGFVSNRYLHQHGFEPLARFILTELSQATGFMSEIDTVDRWDHIVAISEGRMAQSYLRPVEGARLPLMPTAAARVILADVPEAVIRENVSEDKLFDAAGEPMEWPQFFAEMRLGALRGFITVEGWLGGTTSTLACPIFAGSGQIVASLCLILPGPSAEPYLKDCLGPLRDAADRLTGLVRRVGWPAAENGKELMCRS